jgi:hypothetical protein
MLSRRLFALLSAVPLLALSTSSSSCGGLACTLIGCESGLIVRFTGNVPAALTVTASPETGPSQTRDCSTVQACSAVFFVDLITDDVSITVESAAGSTTQSFTPTYRRFQPNGEDCDPICRIAEIEMNIP